MPAAVLDASVVIAWMRRRDRAQPKLDALFDEGRMGRADLVLSVVNLAEVLRHTADVARDTGVDPVALLKSYGVRLHAPDDAVARRVARLRTSLADGFAAATALELGATLHTTDAELVAQLASTRVRVKRY